MFKTWVTEALGIKYPIIQGAVLWLARAELASAVSNAGGLGIIGATSFYTPEEFQKELQKMKSLTDKPFGVNITLMPTRRQINWEEYIYAAIEAGVSIIETSGRSPEPYMKWFKKAGVKVLHKVSRMRDAITAERIGVDAISIVGVESGGHTGMDEITSLVFIPRAVDAVNIPVIAAGGFYDGRGLVAALALGAEGVIMGTRFMASKECPMHPKIKETMLKTGVTDTMLIERSIKNTARAIKNDLALKVLEMEGRGATLDELFPFLTGERIKKAYASGDAGDAVVYCGQVVGSIDSIPGVKEIIDGIVSEAWAVMERLNKLNTRT